MKALIVSVALAALAGAASAESAYDLLFRTGTLAGLDAGDRLEYAAVAPAVAGKAGDATFGLALREGGRVTLERAEGESPPQVLAEFDATTGNPMAMFFLETTTRRVAEATGGSPFYIRNRIKDAVFGEGDASPVAVTWNGHEIAATEVRLAPFEGDPHRSELGPFADLEITVVMSEEVPGWYLAMRAETPDDPALGARIELSEVTR